MSKPLFVAISDIHFTVNNLDLASAALQAAIDKSNELNIPLVIAGDLHDTKAIIRAEVANRLLELIRGAKQKVLILVGNHDLINEKGVEHGLNYLEPFATLVSEPVYDWDLKFMMVPYYSDKNKLLEFLKGVKPGTITVCHQGFSGAAMGDYVIDKSSISPSDVKHLTVISGHYHRHQTIGTVTYIGSPFTHTFGEANDGPKGFLVVNEDGSFTREILNLRKHVIREFNWLELDTTERFNSNDLVWIKVTGPKSELDKLDKTILGNQLLGHNNFKLDLIPTESQTPLEVSPKKLTNEELFDTIIDDSGETDKQKQYLKDLTKELLVGRDN